MKVRRLGVIVAITIAFALGGVFSAWGDTPKKEREDYKKDMQEKMKSLDRKIDEMKGKAVELKEETKKEFNKGMAELREKQRAAKKEWRKVKRTAGNKWEKVKSDMDAAIQDLEKAYDKVASRFKEHKD